MSVRGQPPVFWPINALHEAVVTCADSTAPERAASWFTDEPLLTTSVASTSVDFTFSSVQTLAGFLLLDSNLPDNAGSTFRVRFSSADPFSTVIWDSGTLAADPAFEVAAPYFSELGAVPHLLYALRTKSGAQGVEPDPIPNVLTIRLTLTAPGAISHRIGYAWSSNLATLGNDSATGWTFTPSTLDGAKAQLTSVGASVPTNPIFRASFTVEFPYLTPEDASKLRGLHQVAGLSRPVVFLRPEANGADRFEREAEGGIVSLPKTVATPSRGLLALTGDDRRQSKPITFFHWR